MKLINNISIIFVLLFLTNCVAVGYFDSDDYQTVISQGVGMERMGRFGPAEKRYLKGLQLAEEKNDKRTIAHAKYNLGLFYRNPSQYRNFNEAISYGYIDKAIKYLKESLEFYTNDVIPITTDFSPDIYTALTEVYDKKSDKKSACFYLKKLNYTYLNKIITHPKYAPNGDGYKNFYNATGKKFGNLGELIEYYNQKIGCGI